eukprot:TRINITY_DN2354_c0_g1_i4.p1 TRINITY_DN2354_c0_g1~~TRINITY_DN2354_c0_g1_i4.p1  ORF type:complete len:212 (+),score=-11.07 TRINITY_DN2354_c0_g1_i4:1363-1998(+)
MHAYVLSQKAVRSSTLTSTHIFIVWQYRSMIVLIAFPLVSFDRFCSTCMYICIELEAERKLAQFYDIGTHACAYVYTRPRHSECKTVQGITTLSIAQYMWVCGIHGIYVRMCTLPEANMKLVCLRVYTQVGTGVHSFHEICVRQRPSLRGCFGVSIINEQGTQLSNTVLTFARTSQFFSISFRPNRFIVFVFLLYGLFNHVCNMCRLCLCF